MGVIKNKLLTKWLEKDKLVAVPQSWQQDYIKLSGNIVAKKETIRTLVKEYNSLLKDFFKKNTVDELKELLDDGDIKYKEDAPQEVLANIAYTEFKMTIEKS